MQGSTGKNLERHVSRHQRKKEQVISRTKSSSWPPKRRRGERPFAPMDIAAFRKRRQCMIIPLGERQPVETIRLQVERIRMLENHRKRVRTKDVSRLSAMELRQLQSHSLSRTGKIVDDQHRFVFVASQVSENCPIFRTQECKRAATERGE